MTKKFDKKYLVDELDLPFEAIHDEIIEHSRWSVLHTCVFKCPEDGKFYRTNYSEGATENQDEQPWEYEKEIECTEVELKEVTVKKWVPVKGSK